MKNRTRILLTLVLSLALFAVDGYSAEEKPKPAKAKTEVDVAVAWERRLPEADLGDQLPLAEVAKYLGERFPELNFIVPQGAQGERVPRLKLRNVTLGEIFKAIELASGGYIRGGVPTEPVGVDALGLPMRRTTDNSQGNLVTFSVGPLPGSPSADRQGAEGSKDSPAVVCRVFSLAPYLAYKSEEDAERAINSLYQVLDYAWQMLGKQVRAVQQPELNIHSGTKLLIAVGGERELAVVQQVIKELQGSAPTRTVSAPAENELKSKTANESPKPAAGTKQ